MAIRRLKRGEVDGIAVVGGNDVAGAGNREVKRVVRLRHGAALFIHHGDGDEGKILAIGGDARAVRLHDQFGGRSGGGDGIGGPLLAVFVGDHLEFAGLKTHVVPNDAVCKNSLFMATKGFAVQEQLRFITRSVHVHRGHLSQRPVPTLRHEMRHGEVRAPARLVEIEAVFLETGEVDDAEIRTAGRVIGAARGGGLAKVIPAGPDEFTGDVRILILAQKFAVR